PQGGVSLGGRTRGLLSEVFARSESKVKGCGANGKGWQRLTKVWPKIFQARSLRTPPGSPTAGSRHEGVPECLWARSRQGTRFFRFALDKHGGGATIRAIAGLLRPCGVLPRATFWTGIGRAGAT